MKRIVLVGGGSFIARHVSDAARRQGLDVLSLPHDAALEPVLCNTDAVINFSWNPAYRTAPYSVDQDCDLRVAETCGRAGAFFVMLSTRRVYPSDKAWAATEIFPVAGDETAYGKNKARTEGAVRAALGNGAAILRLSNIFGAELDPSGQRRTFFALALTSLHQHGRIVLDMHPDTRKDFLPVDHCAQAIIACARRQAAGIYNVGCGFPVRCGDIANWILDGFGGGKLVLEGSVVQDEFYLDVTKWRSQLGPLIDEGALREYCRELGRGLL